MKTPIKKVISAIVGEPLAGKETVGDFGQEYIRRRDLTTSRHRFRDVLEETLKLLNKERENGYGITHAGSAETLLEIAEKWSIESTAQNLATLTRTLGEHFGYDTKPIIIGRESLQLMAQIMVEDDAFGEDTLAHATCERLVKSPEQVVWADGVRWFADEKKLRSYPSSAHPDVIALILYVTASEEIRFKRLQMRRREGEAAVALEQFRRQNTAKNEIYIPEIGGRADWKIVNNYDSGDRDKDLEALKKDVQKFCEAMILTLFGDIPYV
ncbi:MAG: hypothetical protein Q7R94_01405 [bacterium]|nr:hypothetical protein [bacterium]